MLSNCKVLSNKNLRCMAAIRQLGKFPSCTSCRRWPEKAKSLGRESINWGNSPVARLRQNNVKSARPGKFPSCHISRNRWQEPKTTGEIPQLQAALLSSKTMIRDREENFLISVRNDGYGIQPNILWPFRQAHMGGQANTLRSPFWLQVAARPLHWSIGKPVFACLCVWGTA
jgi:hypothetical protein